MAKAGIKLKLEIGPDATPLFWIVSSQFGPVKIISRDYQLDLEADALRAGQEYIKSCGERIVVSEVLQAAGNMFLVY